jgi:hypothetical protein
MMMSIASKDDDITPGDELEIVGLNGCNVSRGSAFA